MSSRDPILLLNTMFKEESFHYPWMIRSMPLREKSAEVEASMGEE